MDEHTLPNEHRYKHTLRYFAGTWEYRYIIVTRWGAVDFWGARNAPTSG